MELIGAVSKYLRNFVKNRTLEADVRINVLTTVAPYLLFIAEGGPECLLSKKQELQDCLESNSAEDLVNGMKNPDTIPSLVIGEPQCKEMTLGIECFVKRLETCQSPIPANIVESFIDYLKKSSPCAQYLVESGSGNIVSPLAQTVISAFIVLVVLLYN